jgi:hypothetical protein
MKLALRMVPRGLQERMAPRVQRAQTFVREFEWTWTKAVVASFLLWLFGIAFVAVIPSWWLYFADQTLGWRETKLCPGGLVHLILGTNCGFWLFKLRDVVAIVLFSLPFGALVMVPYHLQKLRRRLRSESESRPTGGYR